MRISPTNIDPWAEAKKTPNDRVPSLLKYYVECLATVAFRHWGNSNKHGMRMLDPLTSAEDIRWLSAERRRWLWLYRVADLMGQRYAIDRGRELKSWLQLQQLPSALRLEASGTKPLLHREEDMKIERRTRS